jgi:hypothetical protein
MRCTERSAIRVTSALSRLAAVGAGVDPAVPVGGDGALAQQRHQLFGRRQHVRRGQLLAGRGTVVRGGEVTVAVRFHPVPVVEVRFLASSFCYHGERGPVFAPASPASHLRRAYCQT